MAARVTSVTLLPIRCCRSKRGKRQRQRSRWKSTRFEWTLRLSSWLREHRYTRLVGKSSEDDLRSASCPVKLLVRIYLCLHSAFLKKTHWTRISEAWSGFVAFTELCKSQFGPFYIHDCVLVRPLFEFHFSVSASPASPKLGQSMSARDTLSSRLSCFCDPDISGKLWRFDFQQVGSSKFRSTRDNNLNHRITNTFLMMSFCVLCVIAVFVLDYTLVDFLMLDEAKK